MPRSITNPAPSGQAPDLTRSVVAVEICSRSASAPPATSRQRPDCGFTRRLCCLERHSWAPVPLQSQKLDRRFAGGPAASDVHALIERAERPVAAVPRPALRTCPVTGQDLDRRAITCAGAGVVDAFVGGAENRTCAAILHLDDGRRVDVVTGVNRWASRRYWPSAQLSGAARPVGRPAVKQVMSARSRPAPAQSSRHSLRRPST